MVGDSGSGSIYTNGAYAGDSWDYVGYLPGGDPSPSSVSYVSNGWFLTAQHVWNNEVIGNGQETLTLGGNSYTISTDSHTSITNASGSAADLCMFRAENLVGLPAGIAVTETTPPWNASFRLIGNGLDNTGQTGMTWGNGTPYWTAGSFPSALTLTVGTTESFLSIYDSGTTGSAYAQTYDSGSGVFTDGKLAGITFNIGTYGGESVTVAADLSAYYTQITNTVQITDVDEDGIPDEWEYEQSGSATGVSASTDQDGDGAIGTDEYIADTDPTDSNAVWQASGDFSVTNQTFTFDGSTARKYQVLYTTNDLADPGLTWISNGVPVWGEGADMEIVVTNTEDTVFYRVWVTLP